MFFSPSGQNKKLPPPVEATQDDGDVSDEDEAAEMESTDPEFEAEVAKKDKKVRQLCSTCLCFCMS